MRLTVLIGAALLATAAPAMANPQDFLTKAMLGDNSETTLGKLASQRATTPAVRRFGAMLAVDHTKGRQQALPVVKRYHVPVTTALAPEADAEQHKLARLHGPAFDREFVRYMVHDHQQDIADFQGELKSGDPADVKALARQTLPVLRKHLRAAQSLRT